MPLPKRTSNDDENLTDTLPDTTAADAPGMPVLRSIGATVALIVMVATVGFILMFGIELVDCFRNPSQLNPVVLQWETLVRGQLDIALPRVEQQLAAGGDPATTPDIVREAAGLMVLGSRPLGIALMLTVIAIIGRLLIAVFSASSSVLAALSSNEAQLMQRLVREISKRK